MMDLLRASSASRLLKRRVPGLSRSAWVCASCRRHEGASRRFASSSGPEKPYYVTTPIFYVNASPHIGHMYSMILADVLKRWQVLLGKRALLCTGTDEHGMKVQRAASLEDDHEKRDPKNFADMHSATFKKLAREAEISNDFFIRTTDPDHIDAVKHFWLLLREKGFIYESKHEGWYSVSDECFFPESEIVKQRDLITGKVYPASKETGNAVEWTVEKNYHLRLTALKDRLLEFYEQNPEWVVPATRMNEVVGWVKNNLEDLSISRPRYRLSWGVEVPDDPNQTVYVWVDALVNYITKAGFPNWPPGQQQEGGWPADVHVIGKDILRFHCVYWPALLLAVGITPPKRILSHAHWTMGRKKMSKSIGNVVNPFFAMQRFGVDTMRFFLLHDGGIANDSDYENSYIIDRYKKLLQGGLGNMLNRITRPKLWSVADTVAGVRDGRNVLQVDGVPYFEQQELLGKLAGRTAEQMSNLNPKAALREIMEAVAQTNKFIADTEPWTFAKKKDEKSKARLQRTIYLSAEALRIIGILLQPFMPSKAAELLNVLGVADEKRTFQYARFRGDFTYGTPRSAVGGKAWDSLFPPLPIEDDALVAKKWRLGSTVQ